MNDKQLVAIEAAKQVQNGMIVGLGTGSTANFFIEQLAHLQSQQGLNFTAVSSSTVSAIKARELGISLTSIEQLTHLDLYVDGADEVSPESNLLKGRGFDLVKEKILAKASDRFIVLVDHSKLVTRIGEKYAIPVEVIPFAWQLVKKSLERLGGEGGLRKNPNQDGLVISSHGSLVLDMTFPKERDIEELDILISNTPGVVEHGIFKDLASVILIGENGEVREQRPPE